MRTTIDRLGRLVIPKSIRDELGLAGGGEVDITLRNGRAELEPVLPGMLLVERDGFLAAELEADDLPPLQATDVRDLLDSVRR
ncbi:MAG: AbrB/MazE/SpoVT family DNA-binding domain-containing protein [Actinomycetota bacterium]|jgi:AbrB family looped-hinge helix DNA binding protein|nr:AbrB/MazE/SpoVT family DNA-binding domain-containing protein [Geodermatophilaceae bacterium]MDQ3056077.1 AbrB/MazE/SpoVT family DNA-binding domain-containing protein [Actinomycetota bacterium]